MEIKKDNRIKRGAIFYYDYGDNPGSIQSYRRPCLILQADDFNANSPTVIVAAITSVIKKQYLPSHILIPSGCGLSNTSMVMLEQIRSVNRSELTDYVGCLDDEETWKRINNGIKKSFGLWVYKNERPGTVMCLCTKCLNDYFNAPGVTLRRLDPFQRNKDKCTKCNGFGFDYIIYDKRKATGER